MAKFELIKSIEARKLNPRTGIPTTDLPVSVPFGAVIEDIKQDRDDAKFYYLGQYLVCAYDVLERAIVPAAQPSPNATAGASGASPAQPACSASSAASAPVPAVAREAAPPGPGAPRLVWEGLPSTQGQCMRAKVPGGWLVSLGAGLAFYPDPAHDWNGASPD